ncbi:MAG TPA: aminotransferase class V-fold PLP-dependent enzyme [Planctomycetota bacterium]|nr:aminotransferase class V-fold PLP-dependent enzyme [Planctomycetota bacterium]
MTRPIHYFDNAATSYPKPPEVLAAVVDYHVRLPASAGRGAYREARAAGEMLHELRTRLCRLFGAPDLPERVVFGLNGTDALNLALKGALRPGDRVVTTRMDHNSVLRPLHALAARDGVEVVYAEPDADGFVTPERIAALLDRPTRMVCVTHASNVSGTVQPVAEIGRLAREHGALFLLDAAQTAGAWPIDVEAMSVDLLACPGHKALLGPQGTGVLWMRPGVELATVREGGTGSRSDLAVQPDELPDRYEPGAHNGPGLAGLLAAVRFVEAAGVEAIVRRRRDLTARLLAGFRALGRCRVLGPADPDRRLPIVSVVFDGVDGARLARLLDDRFEIKVRAGLHCAPFAHRAFGTEACGGAVRFAPGLFTADAEIDRLFLALRALRAELEKGFARSDGATFAER